MEKKSELNTDVPDIEDDLIKDLNNLKLNGVVICLQTPFKVSEYQNGKVTVGLSVDSGTLKTLGKTNGEQIERLFKITELINKKQIEGKSISEKATVKINGRIVSF